MTTLHADYQDAARIINAAYPMPPLPRTVVTANDLGLHEAYAALNARHDQACQYVQKLRRDAFDAFTDFAYSQPNGHTAWGVYNAVVEHEDHIRQTRGASLAAVTGDRARVKVAAFAAAMGA
jgi:hypothetical protein